MGKRSYGKKIVQGKDRTGKRSYWKKFVLKKDRTR